ncbi:hypothetical protein OH710_00745 [Pseudomonas capsici]|uniref:hypothetical protein n=1 Tax=Pseudomonas capsici TaxID=2810614 RepID=UPI0019E3AB6C|nr:MULTISPECIES: hypothetical protein [Pseudomonas]MCV4271156.1 hypothetical protein [Pseudomonas capsici]GFM56371.1 hypothetical protein PSCICF_25490 [Pseudomonas cichorii]GFM59102.1 hypothetical protein PSCICG_02620 [Pseudomonas cichorii]
MKEIIDLVKKIPLDSKANPAISAGESFNMLITAYSEHVKISETEKTKREAITAFKETKLSQIESHRKVLEQYLSNTFKERSSAISGLFDALDKGIESGNSDLISSSIGAIVSITKESPLAGAKEIIGAMYNSEIKTIEI